MNLIRSIRFLLLMLFALLQCVAPVAHAHVNGNNAGHNVHLPSIDSPWLSAHDADAVHFAVGSHHSAVVCMPPESRCSDLKIAQSLPATDKCSLALCEHITLHFVNLYQRTLPLTPYQHPCSQAPPA